VCDPARPSLEESERMDATAFETRLKADGYAEIEGKRWELRPTNGEHSRHVSGRGLSLDGAVIVACGGADRTCRSGEVFEVAAGDMHVEDVPASGVELLIGRTV
jgi:hypothetical protein